MIAVAMPCHGQSHYNIIPPCHGVLVADNTTPAALQTQWDRNALYKADLVDLLYRYAPGTF
jgi:hypothetical protein